MKSTRAYRPGEIYSTNHGSLVIKSNSERMNFRWVKFIATGFEREARIDHIKNGKVADVLHPTIYGVGYLGEGIHKAKVRFHTGWRTNRAYGIWSVMLQRCYSNIDPAYADATVHEDWHNFQTFANDLSELEGFEDWVNPAKEYQLDKDKYGKGTKVYSAATCCFLSHRDNQLLKLAYNGCIKEKPNACTQ